VSASVNGGGRLAIAELTLFGTERLDVGLGYQSSRANAGRIFLLPCRKLLAVPEPGPCRDLAVRPSPADRRVASADIAASSRRIPGGYTACTALAWMPRA
jgi:hypothetical protein